MSKIAGMPLLVCVAIVAAGIRIGHFLIPFHSDAPRLVP